jgi:hypothetical protein
MPLALTIYFAMSAMEAMSTSFGQWLQFVFNNPVKEREWYWDKDFDSRWEALQLTDALIVQYMRRLFLEPEVLRPYSLDQVEQGLWFLIGESSPGCSSESLLRPEAALPDRVACIHAMSSFFRNYVLGVASRHFEPKTSTNGLDNVAYMWWDIFPHAFLHAQSRDRHRRPRCDVGHSGKVESSTRSPQRGLEGDGRQAN